MSKTKWTHISIKPGDVWYQICHQCSLARLNWFQMATGTSRATASKKRQPPSTKTSNCLKIITWPCQTLHPPFINSWVRKTRTTWSIPINHKTHNDNLAATTAGGYLGATVMSQGLQALDMKTQERWAPPPSKQVSKVTLSWMHVYMSVDYSILVTW